MMNAYNKLYLEDAMTNLAVMLDYGSKICEGLEPFFDRFIVSDVSRQFGNGNPRYISGMSGVELAERVMTATGAMPMHVVYNEKCRSAEYWTGWAMAYLQWYTGLSFEKITSLGLSVDTMLSLYPTHHEADISKFVDTAMRIMAETAGKRDTALKRQRKYAGLTQHQLAERTGVKIRMIQAYEQNYQDISKAEAATVIKLANALGCSPEDLLL